MTSFEHSVQEQNMSTVALVPQQWTRLPGTGVAVWWDGEQEIAVAREGGIWNLAVLAVPERVLAWVRLADRPELGAWPVVALASRSVYRSRCSTGGYAELGGQP